MNREELVMVIAPRPSQEMLAALKAELAEMPDEYDLKESPARAGLKKGIHNRAILEAKIENLEIVIRREGEALEEAGPEDELSPKEHAEYLKERAIKGVQDATIALNVAAKDPEFAKAFVGFMELAVFAIFEPMMPYLERLAEIRKSD